MVLKMFLYIVPFICSVWSKSVPADICSYDSQDALLAKPDNCAQFYNCSLTPRMPQPGYLGDYVDECPYPKLFSETTGRCEDFQNVDCGNRKEIVYACDYEKSKCPVSHCRPCKYNYPDCRELPDGMNAWKEMLWTPFYAQCYRGRGSPQSCPKQNENVMIFSPATRRCEPLSRIPKEFGGQQG